MPPVVADAEDSHRTKGLVRLTMACNERCPFCNVPVEDYRRPTPPWEEIAAELDAFIVSGERTLTVSGGEPTLLRKRLLRLIREARSGGVPLVELQTNAVLIDPAYARELAAAGLTSAFVSLLSDLPEHHDALAGLPGAHTRCLAGIDALLAEGVRVALNPVTARRTQARVADFVRFVAARLPGVRSISLSAVQPHGRAGRGGAEGALLPDYDVLGRVIAEARGVAQAADIELLNPYCGLPLCVGWVADPARSVEAIEATAGGWRVTPGLENTGDKTHGPPCQRCAWRTRCGGAWRVYWSSRGGAGLEPPASSAPPWEPGAADLLQQGVVEAPGGPGPEAWRALRAVEAPTVWLHTDHLEKGDALRLASSGCTDLALTLRAAGLSDPASPRFRELGRTLQQVRRLLALTADSQPQRRLRVWMDVSGPGASAADIAAGAEWAHAHGIPTRSS
jgi:pyruvate-formate lyase-activating enzyme